MVFCEPTSTKNLIPSLGMCLPLRDAVPHATGILLYQGVLWKRN